jgi:hypothetical protein
VGTSYPPADAARQRATEILARPEYQPPEKSWLQHALDWVNDSARSFLNSLLAGGAASIISWAVLGGLVVIVVVFAARVSRTVQRVPLHTIEASEARRRSSTDWELDAERFEATGQWKDGLRCRYRALVATLIDRDMLRDVPGRTSGEFRVELAEHAPESAVAAFSGASELFERAWYGDVPTGPAESELFRARADEALGRVHP